MRCEHCGGELIEVDNPMRREVRHRRGVACHGDTALEPSLPPVQEPASGPETPEPSTDRGTGVGGPHARSEAAWRVPVDLTESNPRIRGGDPVMKGTRVPVADVAGLLADGIEWHVIHEYWPSVPLPEGTACVSTECDCHRAPVAEPMSAAQIEAAHRALRPVHYRDAADRLIKHAQHAEDHNATTDAVYTFMVAADVLRGWAEDLETEGNTES